jgi:hypothetical protein
MNDPLRVIVCTVVGIVIVELGVYLLGQILMDYLSPKNGPPNSTNSDNS